MKQSLLVLIVTPAIEDAVVDWLLEQEEIPGFSSMPIHGHGASVHALTAAEQVTGRQRNIMFQLHLPHEVAEKIIAAARIAFHGSGMHYWLTPVAAAGHMD